MAITNNGEDVELNKSDSKIIWNELLVNWKSKKTESNNFDIDKKNWFKWQS